VCCLLHEPDEISNCTPCYVIGVILGALFDETMRRSLYLSNGDVSVFFSRPGAAILLVVNITLIAAQFPVQRRMYGKLRRKAS